ncbi:MAG TPA: hypothetical protein V6D12_04995 [Candidatus Obscuribacterales bacterium]
MSHNWRSLLFYLKTSITPPNLDIVVPTATDENSTIWAKGDRLN